MTLKQANKVFTTKYPKGKVVKCINNKVGIKYNDDSKLYEYSGSYISILQMLKLDVSAYVTKEEYTFAECEENLFNM